MSVVYRKYQIQAMSKWAANNFRGALYWEPGLGKSFVTMQGCVRLVDTGKSKRVLVVVPPGLVNMWEDDLIKAGLNPELLFIYKPITTKKGVESEPSERHRVVIIPYSLIFRRTLNLTYDTFFCDESHNIKSHQSKAYKVLKKIIKPTDKVLLLSGTPFPNGKTEVFSQMDLVAPGVFGHNITQFRNSYCVCTNKDYYTYKVLPSKDKDIDVILHKYCDFRKTSQAVELPPVSYINVPYEMSSYQKNALKEIKTKKIYTDLSKTEIPLPLPAIRLMLLRQVSSGFVNVNLDYRNELGIEFHVNDTLDTNLPKEQTLHDILNSLPQDKQAIVWFAFRPTGERLLEYLKSSFKVAMIYGDTPKAERKIIQDKYRNKEIQFILANPLTLGTGINEFNKTQYMIWYELSYDSAVFEQAEGRINRIGQENHMFIYTLIGKGTVDDKVQFALKNKLDVEKYIFDTYLID